MSCKDFEKLILERDDRALAEEDARGLEGHLRACPACRGFEAGRLRIREALRAAMPPSVPERLDSGTRARALEILSGRAASGRARARTGLPAPIAAALAMLIVLTAAWLTVTLSRFAPGEALSLPAWAALGLIAQNALMLFAAPVLLRAVRTPKNGAASAQ
jgi:anti-sigma factor RsiW